LYIASNTTVPKPVTILGNQVNSFFSSPTKVTLAPAAEDDHDESSFGGTFQHGFIVQSSSVTIGNLTIDGQANLGLTANKSNFRAGIITDFRQINGSYYYFDNLNVHNVTVTNIWRRGVQVSSSGVGLGATGLPNQILNNQISNV